jgi:MFS family permease
VSTRHFFQRHVWLKSLYKKRLHGLWGVYGSSFFLQLGMGLVSIFIPVYVYQLTQQISSVFIFFAFYSLVVMLMSPLTGWLVARFGLDTVAVGGALIRTLSLVVLILSGSNPNLLLLAAGLWGMCVPATWLPYHYTVIAENDNGGRFGKEVAKLKIVEKVSGALAPFCGGAIAFFFGFPVLYLAGIIMVAISALPLVFDQCNKKGMTYKWPVVFRGLVGGSDWLATVSFVGSSIETQVFTLLRPLFIFLSLASLPSLGGIESIALGISALVVLWAGQWVDKKGFSLMKIGVLANAMLLLLLPFLSSAWEFLLFGTVYLLVASLIWTPFDAATYQLAMRPHKLEFLVAREIAIHGGGAIFFVLLLLLTDGALNWFLIAASGSIGLLLTLTLLKRVNHAPSEYRFKIHPTVA